MWLYVYIYIYIYSYCFSFFVSVYCCFFLHVCCIPHQNSQWLFWASVSCGHGLLQQLVVLTIACEHWLDGCQLFSGVRWCISILPTCIDRQCPTVRQSANYNFYLFAETLLLAFVLELFLLYSLSRCVIFEAALKTWLFLYAIVFSLGKGQPRDVHTYWGPVIRPWIGVLLPVRRIPITGCMAIPHLLRMTHMSFNEP